MGARESGPMPWTKLAHVAQVKVENFQKVLQFYISSASLPPLTGHTHPTRATANSPTDREGHYSAAALVLDRRT